MPSERNKNSMDAYIIKVQSTDFYRDFIARLYLCEETPVILWAEFKAPYSKRDEIAFFQATEEFDEIVRDINLAEKNYSFQEV